jgi:hypothetical protein
MFGAKWMRSTGLVTLFCFVFLIFYPGMVTAQESEEDILLKARNLYQRGDYEGSIDLLSKFIQKLKAMVEQKKNVAEAFYLLAKIYFEVGDDAKVDENLRKVFETYPGFSTEEANLGFKGRAEKIKAHVLSAREEKAPAAAVEKETPQPAKEKVIPRPYKPKKKKKKFPVLLVVGGIAVTALIVFLLTKKKKDDYNITGNWIITETYPDGSYGEQYLTFAGGKNSGSFVDQDGYTGTYSVNGENVSFSYDYGLWFSYNGAFTSKDRMSGNWNWTYEGTPVNGTWDGQRGGPGGYVKMTTGSKASGNLKDRFH